MKKVWESCSHAFPPHYVPAYLQNVHRTFIYGNYLIHCQEYTVAVYFFQIKALAHNINNGSSVFKTKTSNIFCAFFLCPGQLGFQLYCNKAYSLGLPHFLSYKMRYSHQT